MNFSESILIAFDSVKGNKLRTVLTLLSVTIGVFAIIGAGTLTSSMENAVTEEVNSLGDATIIISRTPSIQTGNSWRKYGKRKFITYRQYLDFKKNFNEAEYVTAFVQDAGMRVKYNSESTDPNVGLLGGDENLLLGISRNIKSGRALINEDLTFGRDVAIIGNDIVVKIFKNQNPIGKKITVNNHSFEVIGVLAEKGATFGQSQDNMIIIPLTQYLRYFSEEYNESLTIMTRAKNKALFERTQDEVINKFRIIRNLKPWEENDFEVESNDTISDTFKSFTNYLTYFGLICGVIALFAAGIGIMNIMLVSVKERTREIGIRKALGARKSWILYQFIIETITLCQIGAILGIILGLAGAYALTLVMSMSIVFPIGWIIFAIVICTVMGILSGAYPAWKAANLDPIEALRYE